MPDDYSPSATQSYTNADDDEELLPSFGNSLDKFRAASLRSSRDPSTSPSKGQRSSRRLIKNEKDKTLTSNGLIVDEASTAHVTLSNQRSHDRDDIGLRRSPRTPVATTTRITTPTKRKKTSSGSSSNSNGNSIASDDVEQLPSSNNDPSKRQKKKSKRQDGDHGQYEGMPGIPDRIARNLDIIFCGINPGVRSSEAGFHYAHPSNRFYRILHESGLTPHRLKPSESTEMPKVYKLGLTDLVLRCTARADQVSSMEFQAGATTLLRKIIRYKPKLVCFVGMDVYRNFRRHFAQVKGILPDKNSAAQSPGSKARKIASDVILGLQPLTLLTGEQDEQASNVTRLFVIPSTSGLAAGYSDAERVNLLKEAKGVASNDNSGEKAWTLAGEGHYMHGDMVTVRAQDFLEDRIVKSSTGEWIQRVH